MTSKLAMTVGGLISVTLILCVTFLIYSGKETSDLIGLIGTGIMPILAVVVGQQLSSIRQNTNGTMSELLTIVKGLQTEVARRPLPPDGNQ